MFQESPGEILHEVLPQVYRLGDRGVKKKKKRGNATKCREMPDKISTSVRHALHINKSQSGGCTGVTIFFQKKHRLPRPRGDFSACEHASGCCCPPSGGKNDRKAERQYSCLTGVGDSAAKRSTRTSRCCRCEHVSLRGSVDDQSIAQIAKKPTEYDLGVRS
jgi:hypothetical protein